MPRLYDVFKMPEIKALRAVTALRFKVGLEEVLKLPRVRKIRTAGKEVVKFEFRRGTYLLLFPNGYVEVRAPSEEGVREALLAFRDELFKHGLIK